MADSAVPTAASEAGDAGSRSARRSMFAVLLMGAAVASQVGSQSVANVALVETSKSLGLQGGTQVIAQSISMVVLAATVITSGAIADRVGRRKVLLAGLALAAASQLLTAAAADPISYIVTRALTGLALGALLSCSFAFLPALAMPGKTAAAIGLYSAAVSGTVVIVTFAGSALASVNWRLAFVVGPVIAIVALPLLSRVIPAVERIRRENDDIPAHVLLIAGLGTALAGVLNASHGLTDPVTLVLLGGGAALLAIFAVHEKRSADPMFPIEIFAKPVFVAAVVIGLVTSFVNGGLNLQTLNLWQYVLKLSTTESVAAQLPAIVVSIIGAVVVGRWLSAGRLTWIRTVALGFALIVAGSVSLGLAALTLNVWVFLVPMTLLFLGCAASNVIYGQLIIAEAPKRKFGAVTAARAAILQMGAAVGACVSLIMLDAMTVGGVTERLQRDGESSAQISTGVDYLFAYTTTGVRSVNVLANQAFGVVDGAYAHAYLVFALTCGGVALAAGITATALLRRASREPS